MADESRFCGHPFTWLEVIAAEGIHSTKGVHPWLDVICSAPVGNDRVCGQVSHYEIPLALEARAQAAEADADRQGRLLKDALFYLRWQLDDHDKGYDEHGCRCDWSKTVRDFFGFDDPDNALAQHVEFRRARGETA